MSLAYSDGEVDRHVAHRCESLAGVAARIAEVSAHVELDSSRSGATGREPRATTIPVPPTGQYRARDRADRRGGRDHPDGRKPRHRRSKHAARVDVPDPIAAERARAWTINAGDTPGYAGSNVGHTSS